MKKKDNTNKYMILGGVAAFILLVVLVAVQTNQRNQMVVESGINNIFASRKFNEEIKKETSVIVIGMDTCPFCEQALPVMAEATDETDTAIHYVDLNKLSEADRSTVVNEVSAQVGDGWGVPLALAYKNGTVVDQLSGLSDLESYIEFFSKYAEGGNGDELQSGSNVPSQENNDIEALVMLSDYEGLQKAADNDKYVIVLGSGTCPFCQQALPIMDEVAATLSYDIYYIDLNEVPASDRDDVNAWIDEVIQKDFGVPFAAAVEDGKMIEEMPGLRESSEYLEFFENYGG